MFPRDDWISESTWRIANLTNIILKNKWLIPRKEETNPASSFPLLPLSGYASADFRVAFRQVDGWSRMFGTDSFWREGFHVKRKAADVSTK